jgi:hypothetical protein
LIKPGRITIVSLFYRINVGVSLISSLAACNYSVKKKSLHVQESGHPESKKVSAITSYVWIPALSFSAISRYAALVKWILK